MAEPLDAALDRVRALLLDSEALTQAVGSGFRRREPDPTWRKVELRYVDLKGGPHLQVTRSDSTQAFTANYALADAPAAVDEVLGYPFSGWSVESRAGQEISTLRLQVTKRGDAIVHRVRSEVVTALPRIRDHDRTKERLLPEDDPVFTALGLADSQGRIKPSRQAKYRQVEEFLRALDAALDAAITAGALVPPTPENPMRVIDLGCGNAYLTFAAHRYLSAVKGLPVQVIGVDFKRQSREHGSELAVGLGVADQVRFVEGSIGTVSLEQPPHVVLALHACDTATDEALAQAVGWQAPLVLAAPCCHHDVAAQLRALQSEAPPAFRSVLRDGILRERFADTLTDAIRADALREQGYRVEVVEFIESKHTPRNTLLRAVRTGHSAPKSGGLAEELGLKPRIRELLG